MKHLITLPLAVLALVAAACRTTHTREALDDRAGVEAAKHAFLGAWTKRAGETFTLDRLAKAVDTSAGFLSFDGMSAERTVIEGWQAYSGIWGPGMNNFQSASLTEERGISSWIGDDTALTASIARIQGVLPDGNELDLRGHLTLGYQRQAGGWRVVHEHMSLGVKP